MKRRSRTRRVLKWVGLLGCMLIVASWGVSSFGMITWDRYDGTLNRQYLFGQGRVRLYHSTGSLLDNSGWHITGFRYESVAKRLGLGLPQIFWRRSPRIRMLQIPIWLLVLMAAIPTAILWYRDRRPPKGHCQTCGYDLTGNVTGVCPECGAPTRGRPLSGLR